MKVKIEKDCIDSENLISVDAYAQKVGCTRANVYYHIKQGNVKIAKIAGTVFVIDESK